MIHFLKHIYVLSCQTACLRRFYIAHSVLLASDALTAGNSRFCCRYYLFYCLFCSWVLSESLCQVLHYSRLSFLFLTAIHPSTTLPPHYSFFLLFLPPLPPLPLFLFPCFFCSCFFLSSSSVVSGWDSIFFRLLPVLLFWFSWRRRFAFIAFLRLLLRFLLAALLALNPVLYYALCCIYQRLPPCFWWRLMPLMMVLMLLSCYRWCSSSSLLIFCII